MNKKAIGICVGVVVVMGMIGIYNDNQEQARLQEEEKIKIEQQAEEEAERKAEEEAKAKEEQEAIARIKNNPPYVYASLLDDGSVYGGHVHMSTECCFYETECFGYRLNLVSGSADQSIFKKACFCSMCCPTNYPSSNLGTVFNK